MPSTANQATSTLASAVKITDGVMTLQTGDHVHFPPYAPFEAVIGNPDQYHEKVRVTGISGDTMNITRGQDGTSPEAWGASTPVQFVMGSYAGDVWGIGAMIQRNMTGTNTAQALSSSGTITTANLGVSKISTSGAVTGVILQAGTTDGQTIEVINTSANSITMAAAVTSHVADGTSCVIAANTARRFIWENTGTLWYREG